MTAVEAAAWGLLGGFIVEALEHAAAIRRLGGWPWTHKGEPGLIPSLVAVFLRLAASAGLASAAGASSQVAGAFGAVALGITAPLVVERILRQAATVDTTTPPDAKIKSVRQVKSAPARRPPTRTSRPRPVETETSDAG
jgi:hypothetical protein